MAATITQKQREIIDNFSYTAFHNFCSFRLLQFYFALTENSKTDLITLIPPNDTHFTVLAEPGSIKSAKILFSDIKGMLTDIRSGKPNPLTLWNINNSARAIGMSWFESYKETDFQNLIQKDIFKGDIDAMKKFNYVMRFLRHCLSHSIKEDIALKSTDFSKVKAECMKEFGPKLEFHYDYGDPSNPIHVKGYLNFEIKIDWNDVNEGKKFGEIFTFFDLYMLMEFCSNIAIHLSNKYQRP